MNDTRELSDLEKRVRELKERFPAHSIPPALMAELDELEEQLAQLQSRMAERQPVKETKPDSPAS